MVIMDDSNFMTTNRLEAFYDAIIAIIVTVLVLELPQPVSPAIESIWAIKNSYFAYLISFLICTNLWQYNHVIYNHVDKIDSRIIWQNIVLLLFVSLIPYLTVFVSQNPFSLLAQVLYGLDFIIINIILFIMANSLVSINESKYLKEVLDLKNAVLILSILFIIGFVIAFLGYPVAISICCLFTIVRSIYYSLKN